MFGFSGKTKRVYADYASATPLDREVAAAMRRAETRVFGNPASVHSFGREAKKELEDARRAIARLLQVQSDEIIFTSGGTEGNNLAISGFALAAKNKLSIITSPIEHSAVLEPIRALEGKGIHVLYLKVNERGRIDEKDFRKAIEKSEGSILVSIAYANGEIGTIENIRDIGRIVSEYKKTRAIYFHTDASQAANYLRIFPNDLFVDMLAIDGTKIYGPKGAGLLFIRRGTPLAPIIRGGGQERGLRSGTQDVSGAVGLSVALEKSARMREGEAARLAPLRDSLKEKLLALVPTASVNGGGQVLPNFLNICIPGLDAEFFTVRLDTEGIAVSSASACRSISGSGSSYVIEALPDKKDCGASSLRISLGRETTKSDIEKIVLTTERFLNKK